MRVNNVLDDSCHGGSGDSAENGHDLKVRPGIDSFEADRDVSAQRGSALRNQRVREATNKECRSERGRYDKARERM